MGAGERAEGGEGAGTEGEGAGGQRGACVREADGWGRSGFSVLPAGFAAAAGSAMPARRSMRTWREVPRLQ